MNKTTCPECRERIYDDYLELILFIGAGYNSGGMKKVMELVSENNINLDNLMRVFRGKCEAWEVNFYLNEGKG